MTKPGDVFDPKEALYDDPAPRKVPRTPRDRSAPRHPDKQVDGSETVEQVGGDE